MATTTERDRSLGELVAAATAQIEKLVKAEIALAKAEIKEDVKHAGIGAGMFGGAAFFGYFALVFLSVAAAFGISALGIALGWAFLVVGGAYLLLAVLLGLVGKFNLGRLNKVRRTKQTIREDVAWAKALGGRIGSSGEEEREPVTAGEQRTAVGPPAG